MILYILYRLGVFLAMSLPLRFSYGTAAALADIVYVILKKDRNIVIGNMNIVMGLSANNATSPKAARYVFRNFAKYLVDFFRFAKIDNEYIKKYVKIVGLENLNEAISRGKGTIALSAHIGNWELGAAILSLAGYPINAVVLTHRNKRINDFFRRQRLVGNVVPIEIGMALKECFRVLKSNGLLALLGDRDFTKNGIKTEFFGITTLIPRGPSVFSYRIGSTIVPTFMVRNEDDTFTLFLDRPIYPDVSLDEERAVKYLTEECVRVIESYIRRYPSQWYAFKDVWSNNEILRPDTIV